MRRWLRKIFRIAVFLLILMTVLFFVLRSSYREVISELAETQVRNTTSDLTNDAIA